MTFQNQTLDKNNPVPLYYQLQNIIINAIKSNELKEGDCLPTEIELSSIFSISRPTVRQALNNLVNKGYLLRIKGKGTFVTKPKITQEYTRMIGSYNQEMIKKGLIPKTKVLEKKITKADDFIASKLQIQLQEEVVKIIRLRFASHMNKDESVFDNNKPVLITTLYTPYKLLPQLANYDFEVFSFYEVLEKNNLPVRKVIREIEAKNADKEISDILEIEQGSAVQLITSTGFLESGIPIEYSRSFYPGERNKFIIEISR
ncbi:GntR family transcriptional regulator [Maledivibacter halophilus]|uniref:GntR family transcriptional regulator n=1 Tax=Maledivibacter halophilus TaxID=36842 RepID=A0A1T5IE02_9FIRM|nr:GntR family transcriptional regulator [Maledivibacter halophilus]SKC37300.1 GntR family transcriptional regulator [Maledivibacter halophilus]